MIVSYLNLMCLRQEQDWIWKIHKKWEIENVKLVKEKGGESKFTKEFSLA